MHWKQPIDTDIYNWFEDDYLAMNLFIHLLLRARNEDMESPKMYKNKTYQLKRGQVLYGRNKFSEYVSSSPSGTDRALLRLSKVYSKVTSKRSTNYTIVTIQNYDELVAFEQADEQVKNKRRTSKEQVKNTNKNVKKEKKEKNVDYVEASSTEEVFNFENQLEKMSKDKNRHIRLIAAYWIFKEMAFENKDKYSAALKRELRPSMLLKGYTKEEVMRTMKYLGQTANYKWTLETVHKYIDEDLDKLQIKETQGVKNEVNEW